MAKKPFARYKPKRIRSERGIEHSKSVYHVRLLGRVKKYIASEINVRSIEQMDFYNFRNLPSCMVVIRAICSVVSRELFMRVLGPPMPFCDFKVLGIVQLSEKYLSNTYYFIGMTARAWKFLSLRACLTLSMAHNLISTLLVFHHILLYPLISADH